MTLIELKILVDQRVEQGHGGLQVIALDTRSGCSSNIGLGDVRETDDYDDEGTLTEYDNGYQYIPVYLDH